MGNQTVLGGIRILDFSWVLAGPYATRLLGDFGAEVIKVQPPMAEATGAFSQGYYNTWNRNKLGITLDLGKPEGISLAKRLVAISDAVVENFAPRVMVNLGLDYSNLKEVKPDIIMLSLSAMGQTGPWRDYTGFGPTVHAFSGMTHLTSYERGGPVGPGFAYADHVAALCASMALLGALEQRRRTGEGQYIDISETEATASLLGEAILKYSLTGKEPLPAGNRSPHASPHNAYHCRGEDQWCAIAVFTEAEWQGFKRALGNPQWTKDEKFSTLPARQRHIEELDRLVTAWTIKRNAKQVMTRLQREGVSAGVVQDVRALANDPQLKARHFFIELDHPELGQTKADASPIRLSGTPPCYTRAAPTRWQDNDYLYGELLGIGRKQMKELRGKGVI